MENIHEIIEDALGEDIGAGDVTTDSLIHPGLIGAADILAREEMVLAGIDVARQVFLKVNPTIEFHISRHDGSELSAGTVIATIDGPLASILKGERVALNILQRLSGIATLTREYVKRVDDYMVKILDTRKTTPGLRCLEKYAVRVGGGKSHRNGLYDGILIKDNHIAAVGSIREAVKRAKDKAPHTLKIEVEAETIEQVKEALAAGADVIMLDNMELHAMKDAVRIIAGRAVVEASGGVNLESVRRIAETGVNYISVGAITHSARSMDISIEVRSRS